MTGSPILAFIVFGVAMLCAWEVIRGFRTGKMHFGVGSISIDCDRSADPTGFWTYGAANGATTALCIWLIARAQ